MNIFSWIVIIIFFWLVLNAGLILRWRIFVREWPSKKVLIWFNAIMVFVIILYLVLPKSNGNCDLNIIIENKNSISEININKEISYELAENKTIKINNLSSNGRIGIKTQTDAIYFIFLHETHLFTYKHKIKITIIDNKIFVDSPSSITTSVIIEGIEKYDKIIELIK